MSEERTRAPADPRKTASFESPQSAVRQNVASWVLSPSSAKKTIMNVVVSIFISIESFSPVMPSFKKNCNIEMP